MQGRLRALPVGAKILYTAFVIATLVGLLVSARLYSVAVGDAGPRAYYGGETKAAAAAPAREGGPAIDLAPEDAAPKAIVELVPERKLLEVTHFHLFTIPVYVLILAHLWLLASVPAWAHHAGVLVAVASSGLHMAAPWIARGRPELAFLVGSSGAAMLVSLGVIALGATIDMWLPAPKPPAPADMAARLAELRRSKASPP
jgi:hypothetical protein